MKSTIRVLTTVGLVAVALTTIAPGARADSVSFTCAGDNNAVPLGLAPGECFTPAPTALDVAFPAPTLDITWFGQNFDVALPGTWHDSDSYSWLASNGGFFIFDNTAGGIGAANDDINTNSENGGLSEFGTLVFGPGSAPSVPEPATLSLLALALAGVGLMRRRRTA